MPQTLKIHGFEPPSAWIERWAHLIVPSAQVLDLACGAGRHSVYFLRKKNRVCSVDLAETALESIANQISAQEASQSERLCLDLENTPPGQTWPLAGRQFDAVIVTNYLWRPRLADTLALLAPGGVLLYETFASGNETVGKPSRPDFLLRPGELLQACEQAGLRVIAYEDGFLDSPPRYVQRIAACREQENPQALRCALP